MARLGRDKAQCCLGLSSISLQRGGGVPHVLRKYCIQAHIFISTDFSGFGTNWALVGTLNGITFSWQSYVAQKIPQVSCCLVGWYKFYTTCRWQKQTEWWNIIPLPNQAMATQAVEFPGYHQVVSGIFPKSTNLKVHVELKPGVLGPIFFETHGFFATNT